MVFFCEVWVSEHPASHFVRPSEMRRPPMPGAVLRTWPAPRRCQESKVLHHLTLTDAFFRWRILWRHAVAKTEAPPAATQRPNLQDALTKDLRSSKILNPIIFCSSFPATSQRPFARSCAARSRHCRSSGRKVRWG